MAEPTVLIDVSPFSSNEPSFSSVAWVNAALATGASSGASADSILASALVRLQLLGAETSSRIEGTMSRVVTALPRLRREREGERE